MTRASLFLLTLFPAPTADIRRRQEEDDEASTLWFFILL
jgi:hypothetical protein